MRHRMLIIALIAAVASWPVHVNAQDARPVMTNGLADDPVSLGKPFSSWLKVIRDRDLENIDSAFDAMVDLGPAAWRAVPELTHIVAEPFDPIRIGTDSPREILTKLAGIHIRAGAVDSLGAVGVGAASSADAVVRWALTLRVLPPETPGNALFIDLVSIDVLERMRGAGAIGQFGPAAAPVVQALLESENNEERKFAGAILNESVLPISASLMNSESCRDRTLGLSVLANMWPVVPIEHLNALHDRLGCTEDSKEKAVPVNRRSLTLRRIHGRP